ncbi:MAG TPA: tetratricopeptide repeat protein [Marinobacterium sp.]|nr:tetratricopeptide repeat protein [Marinobacterium sp.]
MAELRTEEEQVEFIKNWWKENGMSLLISIGIAVSGVVGWKAWVSNQEADAANASALYENISTVVTASVSDDAQLKSVFHLGEQLKSEYGSSAYAPMAAMLLARAAVEAGELDKAKAELEYVVSSEASDTDLQRLANLRLARVALAQAEYSAAEAALNAAGEAEYESLYHELAGDIAVAKGDLSAARAAYTRALQNAAPQARSLIQLKLDDIAAGDAS